MAHKGMENLRSLATLSPEERRAISSKGGKAAQMKLKERKTFAEAIRIALSQDDVQDNVVLAMIKAAREGNVNAFLALRDTIGEKPVEKSEVTTNVTGTLDERREAFLEQYKTCKD